MKIKLLEVESKNLVNGVIRIGKKEEMPSLQTGWVFNFEQHIKKPNSKTFVLVTEDTPTIIEGCMVFEMKEKKTPYLAYIEIAPKNKGSLKSFDYVAGCLIAYACELSFSYGKGHYEGYLYFDVMEENILHQQKLMAVYSQKYKAKRMPFVSPTAMIIVSEDGKALMNKYLKR